MTGRILIIEPFYGGSHKQLIDLISQEVKDYVLFTMPAKKWPWHARTSALYFSQVIPETDNYRVLFCSSVLNLAELSALRPDLGRLRKVLYFHENQLVYPVRKHQERDFQFGYNQILSCLVADEVLFNSKYNQDSFLNSIHGFLKLIPDHRPKGLAEQIRPKCRVLYFPLKLSPLCDTPFSPEGALNRATNRASQGTMLEKKCSKEAAEIIVPKSQTEHVSERNSYVPENCSEECEIDILTSRNSGMGDDDEQCLCHDMKLTCSNTQSSKYICSPKKDSQLTAVTGPGDELKPLHIVWAHRWEHDKDPGTFFDVLCQLQESRVDFRVSVLGECFHEVPDSFREARESLGDRVCVWGYQKSKTEYYRALQEADVAVSTAIHEFFGVAMLEAANMGCFPLCPNRLVYPEIFPKECLYNTSQQLYKRLREFCRRPHLVRASNIKSHLNLERFNWETLRPKYLELLSADHS